MHFKIFVDLKCMFDECVHTLVAFFYFLSFALLLCYFVYLFRLVWFFEIVIKILRANACTRTLQLVYCALFADDMLVTVVIIFVLVAFLSVSSSSCFLHYVTVSLNVSYLNQMVTQCTCRICLAVHGKQLEIVNADKW